MPTFSVNGQRIYARDDGPRQGQLALLIHGWSSSWYSLSPLMAHISRRYRTLAVDLPGYGNSPRLPQRTTIEAYVDLLAELIRDMSPCPAVLVGHSMGGMISITLALRHPELVERMVLIGPTISGRLSRYIDWVVSPITHLERSTVGSKLARFVESQFVSLTEQVMRPALFAERSGISAADYNRIRADARRPGQGRIRAECYHAMRDNDLRGKLKDIEAPTLVIWGAEDNTVPLRDASVIAEEWPTADLRILAKAGHWPQFETPESTRRYIASFLGLPLSTGQSDLNYGEIVSDVREVAQLLGSSDIGNNLNVQQRMRLAALFRKRSYAPNEQIVEINDTDHRHLFIISEGAIEVLLPPDPENYRFDTEHVATIPPGHIAGELALLDSGQRSATLQAGMDGATVLLLEREQLLKLCEESPDIGLPVLWNIAATLAQRLRLTLKTTSDTAFAGSAANGHALIADLDDRLTQSVGK